MQLQFQTPVNSDLIHIKNAVYTNISITGSGNHKYVSFSVPEDIMPFDATFISVQITDWRNGAIPFSVVYSTSERKLYIISTSGLDGTISSVTVQFAYMA